MYLLLRKMLYNGRIIKTKLHNNLPCHNTSNASLSAMTCYWRLKGYQDSAWNTSIIDVEAAETIPS